MPQQLAFELEVAGIERRGDRITAWGRCADADMNRLHFVDDSSGASVPARYGFAFPELDLGPGNGSPSANGFVLSAGVPTSATVLHPVATSADGTRCVAAPLRLPASLPEPLSPAHSLGMTAAAAMARLLHGDLRGFVQDARRRLGIGGDGLGPAQRGGLIKAVAALRTDVLLLVDHQLGGGSKIYRDALLAEAAGQGQPALLLQYHESAAAYLWTLHTPGGIRRFVTESLGSLLALLDSGYIHALTLNNCVSYPNPLDLVAILALSARRHGLTVRVPVHDYFCICPSFPLLDHTGRYCGVPVLSVCEGCMARNTLPFMKRSPRTALTPWRLVWRELLARSTVITFCRDSGRLLRRAYPSLSPEQIRMQPHEPTPFSAATAPRSRSRATSKEKQVAIVGQISYLKGADIVAELVRLIDARQLPLRVTVIGALERPIRSRRLRVTGAYRRDDLPALLARHHPDCVLLPSIWPETYSLVTAELMALGLPIIAFDLGAPAERLRAYHRATLVSEVSAERMLDAILASFAGKAIHDSSM